MSKTKKLSNRKVRIPPLNNQNANESSWWLKTGRKLEYHSKNLFLTSPCKRCNRIWTRLLRVMITACCIGGRPFNKMLLVLRWTKGFNFLWSLSKTCLCLFRASATIRTRSFKHRLYFFELELKEVVWHRQNLQWLNIPGCNLFQIFFCSEICQV